MDFFLKYFSTSSVRFSVAPQFLVYDKIVITIWATKRAKTFKQSSSPYTKVWLFKWKHSYITKRVFCKIFIFGDRPHPVLLSFLSFCTCTQQNIFKHSGLLATTFLFKEGNVYASILWFVIVVSPLSFTRKTTIIKNLGQCPLCLSLS